MNHIGSHAAQWPLALLAALGLCLAPAVRGASTVERDARLQAWSADWAESCYLPDRGDGPPELAAIRARLADPDVFSGYLARVPRAERRRPLP